MVWKFCLLVILASLIPLNNSQNYGIFISSRVQIRDPDYNPMNMRQPAIGGRFGAPSAEPTFENRNLFLQNQKNTQKIQEAAPQVTRQRPTLPDLMRTTPRPAPATHNNFNANLFYLVTQPNTQKNVVFSPFSVKTLLAMINSGAEGQTSKQIQSAVGLPDDKVAIATNFRNIFQSQANVPEVKLQTANKLFFAKREGSVKRSYKTLIEGYFRGEVEGISFDQPAEAANTINYWVSRQTGNRINNLVSPQSISWDTSAILVNAVYFKAKWQKEFSTRDTQDHEFDNGMGRTFPIPMMFIDDVFNYAEVPQLNAKMIEMPYVAPNMSMICILPNEVRGLPELEAMLRNTDLDSILRLLTPQEIKIRIPKFKIQFDIDLQEPLQRMGVYNLFTDTAELPGIVENSSLRVSKIYQKAILDVNEAGSEAAASSYANFVPLALPVQQKVFTADHPFVFLIRHNNEILFIGHFIGNNDH